MIITVGFQAPYPSAGAPYRGHPDDQQNLSGTALHPRPDHDSGARAGMMLGNEVILIEMLAALIVILVASAS